MARILIVAGDGNTPDLEYAAYRMREEQFQVTIVAPKKKRLHVIFYQQEPGCETQIERPWYPIDADAAFDEIDPSAFDALLLPGGRAPLYLRNIARCVEIVRHFVESDKPIGAICRGPLILLEAGVKGRRLTGSNLIRLSVDLSGCTYVEERREAIVDGNIVTATETYYFYNWIRAFLIMLRERGHMPGERST